MARQKGTVQQNLPPINREKGREWDDKALLAQANPGNAVLAAEHVHRSRYETARQYRREPYFTSAGRIRVHIRNSKVEADGQRYGDLWFVWENYESEEANAPADDKR